MTVNVELLDSVLAHIEAHPETWHQGNWRCQSGMCFAGHLVDRTGGMWRDLYADDSMVFAEAGDYLDGTWLSGGMRVVTAFHRAQRLSGLNDDQADLLFDACNTLDDLRRIVAEIKAGAEDAEVDAYHQSPAEEAAERDELAADRAYEAEIL